jgi:hypothetical protein
VADALSEEMAPRSGEGIHYGKKAVGKKRGFLTRARNLIIGLDGEIIEVQWKTDKRIFDGLLEIIDGVFTDEPGRASQAHRDTSMPIDCYLKLWQAIQNREPKIGRPLWYVQLLLSEY